MDTPATVHYVLPMPSRSALYDNDFYAWSNQQASLLRAGKLDQADLDNIAEEIESMGRTEKRELVSRLTVLVLHLLKWQFQPLLRSPSWRATIRVQRRDLTKHMADNPSLKSQVPDAVEWAYGNALVLAETETGLPEATFPATCPYEFGQMMDEGFWPE